MAAPNYEMNMYHEANVPAAPHHGLLYNSDPQKGPMETQVYPVSAQQYPPNAYGFPDQTVTYDPHAPGGPTHTVTFEEMSKQDLKTKRWIRRIKFVARVLILLIATVDLVAMLYMLGVYYTTKDDVRTVTTSEGTETRGPWHSDTQLWPTIVLLSISVLTFVASVLVMFMYCCSVNAANNAANWSSYTVNGLHVAIWLAGAIAYRIGKTTADLWGWSCDPGAAEIQPEFKDLVNFEDLCSLQSSSWNTSIAQTVVLVFTILVYYLAYRRLHHQREMHRHYSDRYEHKEDWVKKLVPRVFHKR